jgi:hypothetical protein
MPSHVLFVTQSHTSFDIMPLASQLRSVAASQAYYNEFVADHDTGEGHYDADEALQCKSCL